jgi:hypothetical protein
MQSQDRNGAWMEWLDEIRRGESTFDPDYVAEVLLFWYSESNESIYFEWLKKLETI